MVTVNYYYQSQQIVKVKVTGHSLFAKPGKDIVCAGISAVVIGTLNTLDELVSQDSVKIVKNDVKNEITIQVQKPESINQIILQTMFWQLKTISAEYPKNITIKEVY